MKKGKQSVVISPIQINVKNLRKNITDFATDLVSKIIFMHNFSAFISKCERLLTELRGF